MAAAWRERGGQQQIQGAMRVEVMAGVGEGVPILRRLARGHGGATTFPSGSRR